MEAIMLWLYKQGQQFFLFYESADLPIALWIFCSLLFLSFYYTNNDKFQKTLSLIDKELQTTREEFIKHFRNTYIDPYPPSWMLSEILPFGVLTRVYENIANNQTRKNIARNFGLNVPVFTSWLTIIAVTRNACCHHARLWNISLDITPSKYYNKTPKVWLTKDEVDNAQSTRLYYTLCLILYLLQTVNPRTKFKIHFKKLLSDYPDVNVGYMGFPNGWERHPLWK